LLLRNRPRKSALSFTVHHLPVISHNLDVHDKNKRRNCLLKYAILLLDYNKTACRSAKVLQVPLLYINNIIIEGIALDNHWFSIKIRQIIDDAYEKFLSTLEKSK